MPDRGAKFRPPEGGCKCDPDCPCHQLQPLTQEQIEKIEETFDEEDCDEEEAVALVKSLDEAIEEVRKATKSIRQYNKELKEQDPTFAGIDYAKGKDETRMVVINPKTRVVIKILPHKQSDSVWEEVHATFCDCEFCREVEGRRLEREKNRIK